MRAFRPFGGNVNTPCCRATTALPISAPSASAVLRAPPVFGGGAARATSLRYVGELPWTTTGSRWVTFPAPRCHSAPHPEDAVHYRLKRLCLDARVSAISSTWTTRDSARPRRCFRADDEALITIPSLALAAQLMPKSRRSFGRQTSALIATARVADGHPAPTAYDRYVTPRRCGGLSCVRETPFRFNHPARILTTDDARTTPVACSALGGRR